MFVLQEALLVVTLRNLLGPRGSSQHLNTERQDRREPVSRFSISEIISESHEISESRTFSHFLVRIQIGDHDNRKGQEVTNVICVTKLLNLRNSRKLLVPFQAFIS